MANGYLGSHHFRPLHGSTTTKTTTAMPNQPKDRKQKRMRPSDPALDPKQNHSHISVQPDLASTAAGSPSNPSGSPAVGIPGHGDTEDGVAVLEKL